MSQRNDESSAMATGMALVIVGIAMLAMALFAILAFITLILSIACLLAWEKPLRIGKLTLEPEEARLFVYRGLGGAAIVPVFIAFCQLLLGLEINWDYWPYFLMVGYIAGSLVAEIVMASDDNAAVNDPAPALPMEKTPPPKIAHTHSGEEFRFASWEDKEERP